MTTPDHVKRCTKFAADYLPHLRSHPLYLDVLARLEAIPGMIFELDVERAFFEVAKEKPPPRTNTAPESTHPYRRGG